MSEFEVDFIYKTYHTARVTAESPEEALEYISSKTYGAEPDYEADKQFLEETLDPDEYHRVSVEAHVCACFVWDVDNPEDPCPYYFDTYEEAKKAAGDKYDVESHVIEYENRGEYRMPCKFSEYEGFEIPLRESHILAILPLLKRGIEGNSDSEAARVAYNRLLLALEGNSARDRCYNPSGWENKS